MRRHRLEWSSPGYGKLAGFCGHGNEPSSCIECRWFPDLLRKCWNLKKDSAPWGYLVGLFVWVFTLLGLDLSAGGQKTREIFLSLISGGYYVTLLKNKIPHNRHQCGSLVVLFYSNYNSCLRLKLQSLTYINPLKPNRRPLYLKTQSVPRCKHFSSRL